MNLRFWKIGPYDIEPMDSQERAWWKWMSEANWYVMLDESRSWVRDFMLGWLRDMAKMGVVNIYPKNVPYGEEEARIAASIIPEQEVD